MENRSQNKWDADLYDAKLGFVSQFGKGLIELLQPQQGEFILDLGCGTGDLTNEIAGHGAIPLGIDLSAEMIARARQKYPSLRFLVENAETFRTDQPFDAVFSNAALHWMNRPVNVTESVWEALRPGGRFVAEFGGKGNVQTIVQGITDVLAEYGIKASERNPWYYPSIGEYSTILENCGFRVIYALHFDRPTPLGDGEHGLTNWLDSFAGAFFQGFTPEAKSLAYQQIAEKLQPALYQHDGWTADYKRIRIVAVKE